jgi:hypothetical protein
MEIDIPNIDFHEGLPNAELIEELTRSKKHSLVVLDDLMVKVIGDPLCQELFTLGSHHKNLSVIFITQNLFCDGKFARTISLNTHYLIIFKNLRDALQINELAKRMLPGKSLGLVEAYRDAIRERYSYIVIDMSPHTNDKYRFRTRIFPGEDLIIYTV